MEMDIAAILKEWASFGVGGVLAIVIFQWYRKDMQHYTELWRGQSEALIVCVKDVTVAITSNTEMVRTFHNRLEQIEEVHTHQREDDEVNRMHQRDVKQRRTAGIRSPD